MKENILRIQPENYFVYWAIAGKLYLSGYKIDKKNVSEKGGLYCFYIYLNQKFCVISHITNDNPYLLMSTNNLKWLFNFIRF